MGCPIIQPQQPQADTTDTGLQKLEFLENFNFLALAQPTPLNLLIHTQAELTHP